MHDSTSACARLLGCTEVMQLIFEHLQDNKPFFEDFKSCRLTSRFFLALSGPLAFKSINLQHCTRRQLQKFAELIAPAYGSLVRELEMGRDNARTSENINATRMGLPMQDSDSEIEDEIDVNDRAKDVQADTARKDKPPARIILEDTILAKCSKLKHLSYEFPDQMHKYTTPYNNFFLPLASTLTSLCIASTDVEPVSKILGFFHGESSMLTKLVYEYIPYEEEELDNLTDADQELLEAIIGIPSLVSLTIYYPPFLKAKFNAERAKLAFKCSKLEAFEHRLGNRMGWEGQILYSPINPSSLMDFLGLFSSSVQHVWLMFHDSLFGMTPSEIFDMKPILILKLESLILASGGGLPPHFDALRPTFLVVDQSMPLDIAGNPLTSRILNRKDGNNIMANVREIYLTTAFWARLIRRKGLEHAQCASEQIELACEKEGIELANGLAEFEENPERLLDLEVPGYDSEREDDPYEQEDEFGLIYGGEE